MEQSGRRCPSDGKGARVRYVKVYGFMCSSLKLAGVELLVFARIFGFTLQGLPFFESRSKTAEFLGCSRRAVITAIGKLEKKALIIESFVISRTGAAKTKEYFANLDLVIEIAGIDVDELCMDERRAKRESPSPPCMPTGELPATSQVKDVHLRGVKNVHPIPKGYKTRDRKPDEGELQALHPTGSHRPRPSLRKATRL